jgi:hypothetical protein
MKFYDYFQSYDGHFWQWEDNTEVIGIPGGDTICYREYAMEVLEKLAPQGIPPFGSLLLAIIATNSVQDGISVNSTLASYFRRVSSTSHGKFSTVNEANDFLNILSKVPEKYKTGNNRILLLQALFANCHNPVAAQKAGTLYRTYYYKNYDTQKLSILADFNETACLKDFRTIALLHKKFPTVESILEQMTGLPLIEEENLPLPPETDTEKPAKRDFIEELIEEEKTFHVGSLVRRIWSGLNIPLHNVLPSQQPIGGVSDLTNKGEFDRLLISEFANDDLIFLSRLANNEALYINREIPPVADNLERVILLDVSIKNWGTPKTIAFALLVAIANHPKTDIHCTGFAVGNHYYPVAFDSVDAIISSLQYMEAILQSSAGLEAFFKEVYHDNMEVFFVSSAETMKMPALQKTLSDYQGYISYWIQTDAEGNIDFYKKQHNSRKLLQKIVLPLEELWKKPKKPRQLPQESIHIDYYPILFPSSTNIKHLLTSNEGELYQITGERNLLRFGANASETKKNEKGWELVYENLPSVAGEFEIGRLSNGQDVLLRFDPQDKNISILNLNTGIMKSVDFKEWKPSTLTQFVFISDRFYYYHSSPRSNEISIWSFKLEENIEIQNAKEVFTEIIGPYNKKVALNKLLTQNLFILPGILKNITSVFINEAGNLVFNIHELQINSGGVIKLKTTRQIKKQYEATQTSENTFTFSNGSSIMVNRSGMLVLRSNKVVDKFQLLTSDKIPSHEKKILAKAVIVKMSEMGIRLWMTFNEKTNVIHTGFTKTEAEKIKNEIQTTYNKIETGIEIKPDNQPAVFIPSVVEASLGVATYQEFAGNAYYMPSEERQTFSVLGTHAFWQKNITTFISDIMEYENPNISFN